MGLSKNQLSFTKWLKQPTYVGLGTSKGTMEEAMLYFFYDGLSPWITSFGYKWSQGQDVIAKKFLNLCYTINTIRANETVNFPEPKHRNFPEDSDTFDYLVDTFDFTEFLEQWSFRNEIVGKRYDYLLREFCYIWIDVTSGKPGSFTQKIFDAEDADNSEEEIGTNEAWSSRKRWDLY